MAAGLDLNTQPTIITTRLQLADHTRHIDDTLPDSHTIVGTNGRHILKVDVNDPISQLPDSLHRVAEQVAQDSFTIASYFSNAAASNDKRNIPGMIHPNEQIRKCRVEFTIRL